jgi:chorismate synthase
MLRFLTAGESHGPALTAIVEGLPAGLPLALQDLQTDLTRRRQGYGRGGRMKIEGDEVIILSGVRHGLTLGSPIALQITNKDWPRWQQVMAIETIPDDGTAKVEIAADEKLTELKGRVTSPRPGHADLAGTLKYRQNDIRNILERASARETAARVAVGAVARRLLAEFGIEVFSGVIRIGKAVVERVPADLKVYREKVRQSQVAAPDEQVSRQMMAQIDQAKESGNSLGGIVEVIIQGVPVGLGSHVQWDRRLDARMTAAMMSIPAIKAVEVGLGFQTAEMLGSEVHDPIYYDSVKGFYHQTNNAGGIEGGISNGELIRLGLAMKPIPTLYQPLQTVDMDTGKPVKASIERSDTCAVPAAAVVAEAMACWVIAEALMDKFGGDSLPELLHNYRNYLEQIRSIG